MVAVTFRVVPCLSPSSHQFVLKSKKKNDKGAIKHLLYKIQKTNYQARTNL